MTKLVYNKDENQLPNDYTGHIEWYKDSYLAMECFYKNDRPHNLDGPAITCYQDDGKFIRKEWYIEGYKIATKTKRNFNLIYMKNQDYNKYGFEGVAFQINKSIIDNSILLDEFIGYKHLIWRIYLLPIYDIMNIPVIKGMFEDD